MHAKPVKLPTQKAGPPPGGPKSAKKLASFANGYRSDAAGLGS